MKKLSLLSISAGLCVTAACGVDLQTRDDGPGGDGDADSGDGDGDSMGDGDGDLPSPGDGDGDLSPGDGDGDGGGSGQVSPNQPSRNRPGRAAEAIGGMGGMNSMGGASPGEPCAVDVVESSLADVSSVGIVEFETNFPFEEARIEFWKDGEMHVAPVDPSPIRYRTLLLGMTYDSTYSYRIVLEGTEGTCRSRAFTIQTGERPQDCPKDFVVTQTEGATTSDGFVIVSHSPQDFQNWATIYNMKGELVWALEAELPAFAFGIEGLRMSPDGQFLWAVPDNFLNTNGVFEKMSLTGAHLPSSGVPSTHHDLAFFPEGEFLYIARDDDGFCDAIYEYPNNTLVLNLKDAFPSYSFSSSNACGARNLYYNAFDHSFAVSVRELAAIVNFDIDGTINWVFGSADSSFDLGGADLYRITGFHLADENTLAFFENEDESSTAAYSKPHIVELDFQNAQADFVWSWDSGQTADAHGDIQLLPSGNRLVTHANSEGRLIREVNAAGEVVLRLENEHNIGYVDYLESLYEGPLRGSF